MSESANFTPLRTPIPVISHFPLFGLRPKICEKCLKVFNKFITDAVFLRKKGASSA